MNLEQESAGANARRDSRGELKRIALLGVVTSVIAICAGCYAMSAILEPGWDDPTEFSGDDDARGARVFVNGMLIDEFRPENAYRAVYRDRRKFSFYKPLASKDHAILVILSSGDSLSTRFRPRGSGPSVHVVASESRLDTFEGN